MVIVCMRLEKPRQVDLNLLIVFTVVAEEKSVTRVSPRLLISPPTVCRALQRARSMFQDDWWFAPLQGFELRAMKW